MVIKAILAGLAMFIFWFCLVKTIISAKNDKPITIAYLFLSALFAGLTLTFTLILVIEGVK